MAQYIPQTQREGGEAKPQSVPSNNEALSKIIKNELSRTGMHDEFERNSLIMDLNDKKNNYIKQKDNKIEQNKIIEGLNERANIEVFHDSQKRNMATILNDPSRFGSNAYDRLGDENAKFFSSIISSSIMPTNRNNIMGYINPETNDFVSAEEINDILSSNNVDKSSIETMKVLLDDTIRQAGEIQPSENSDFNYQKEFDNIKNKVIETGNLYSLTNDKIFGNRVFKNDLESAIMKGTYADLGITADQIKDPTPKDGKITEADAKKISEALIKDENMLKDYLAEYYTKALEQNFNNNLSPAVKRNKKMNQYTPQSLAMENDPYEFMK